MGKKEHLIFEGFITEHLGSPATEHRGSVTTRPFMVSSSVEQSIRALASASALAFAATITLFGTGVVAGIASPRPTAVFSVIILAGLEQALASVHFVTCGGNGVGSGTQSFVHFTLPVHLAVHENGGPPVVVMVH